MTGTALHVRDLEIGGGGVVIIAPLVAEDLEGLRAQQQEMLAAPVDVVEWRVDPLVAAAETAGTEGDPDLEAGIAIARAAAGERPLLVTVRTDREGGQCSVDPARISRLQQRLLGTGEVDLLDLELLGGDSQDAVAAAHDAGAVVMGSHHRFDGTPTVPEMERTLRELAEAGADIVKLAVMPHAPADVLALLRATRSSADALPIPVVTMSMGSLGTVSRLAGAVSGSAATFATVGRSSAPGQIPARLVRELLDASREMQEKSPDRLP